MYYISLRVKDQEPLRWVQQMSLDDRLKLS